MKKISRIVSTGFWEDSKVIDSFSPEDKYFMLWLLTNPHTNQLGIYECPISSAAFELGYSKDSVKVLFDRFENKYGIIQVSKKTGEIAIKNYLKYSVVKGGKPVMDCLLKDESTVKDKELLSFVFDNLTSVDGLNQTVSEFIDHISNDLYSFDNDDENENDNDNERFDDDSYHDSCSHFFEVIWNAYPRKLGKGKVKNSTIKKLYKNVGEEQMLRCIERYKEATAGTEDKYIMHGSTFFNSGYVDYLDANVKENVVEEKPVNPRFQWQ